MTTQLYLSKGDADYLGNEITEDRYIIVDENGFDTYGTHFTLDEANELISNN